MNQTLLVCIGIVLLGFLIFLFLIFRARRKAEGIVHYEAIRDKLTVRKKPEPKKEIEISDTGLNLRSLIISIVMIGLILAVGFSILSEIQNVINETAVNSAVANVTSTSSEALGSAMNFIPVLVVGTMVTSLLAFFMIHLNRKELL